MAGIVLTLINRWKGNAPETLPIADANGTIDYLGAVLLICATVALVAMSTSAMRGKGAPSPV
jgi:hypothetical protein